MTVTRMLSKLDACRALDERLGPDQIPRAADLRALAPNGGAAGALATPAADRWREAYEHWQQACVDSHGVAVLDDLRGLLHAFNARYREAKRNSARRSTSPTSSCGHARCCATTPVCARPTRAASRT